MRYGSGTRLTARRLWYVFFSFLFRFVSRPLPHSTNPLQRHISLSSAMHDIDLAVEKGRAAAELSPAEQKKADLANLELLVSRVADQASSRSHGGGTLKQIKEFNAFLERAAAVLEGR